MEPTVGPEPTTRYNYGDLIDPTAQQNVEAARGEIPGRSRAAATNHALRGLFALPR
jgi:hypothetical protein